MESGILDFRIQLKESRIPLTIRIQNPESRIQNPLTNTVIQYLESRIHGVESIPRLSWITLHGAKNLLMMFINTVTRYEAVLRSSRKFYVQSRDLQRIISYSNNSVKLK